MRGLCLMLAASGLMIIAFLCIKLNEGSVQLTDHQIDTLSITLNL